MGVKNVRSIAQADTLEKMGECWDSHDFTDFDNLETPDVTLQIACAVPIELERLSAVEQQARLRGVQVETLINLWVQQKLAEQSPKRSRIRGSAPNPYEVPGGQETDSPQERIFAIFPLGFRLSVVPLWQRVLSSFPFAGAPTGLPQTRLEVLSSQ